MPRVNRDDVDKYSSSGGGGSYFRLKDDGDTASVRFMLDDVDDLNNYIYAVHSVKIKGAEYPKDVNCLREYNDPVDVCPLCAAKEKLTTKLYLPVYNIDDDAVQIWTRSKTFIQKMTSLCTRYKDMVSHTFDIERNGKAHDQKTTYEIYETDQDDTMLQDLPEIPEILGRYVMDKTADDMAYYLEAEEFPPADEDEPKVHRRSRHDEQDDEDVEERPRRSRRDRDAEDKTERRRTPANRRGGRKEDKF